MNDPTHTPCVVVADDESATRSLLGRLLRRHGYEVLEATDGEEAISLAVSRPVDLILCDLQMPRMRGEELGRWLEKNAPHVPVILMTAYPGYESALAAVRCQAADYLEKPFRSIDGVVDAVGRAIARRRAAAEAQRPQERRDPVGEMRRRFIAAVARESRTPLDVIRSLTQLLGKGVHGPLTSEQREILGHLGVETEALAHEIDKLQMFSRLESGEFRPSPAPVTAANLLIRAERALRARAVEAGADLQIAAPGPGVAVGADADDIVRALLALGENAVRFAGSGGHVVLRAVCEDTGVRFLVEDTGIGIAPADQERVFDPFVRLDNPITRRHPGCGVGLSFAARIVASHGTRIHVSSAPARGAVFSFVLPYACAPRVESQTAELSGAEGLVV